MQRTTEALPGPVDLHVRALHMREVRSETREADFICSTAAIDSYDESVAQTWDLRRYQANPIVLFAHQSRELPIGKATNIRVEDGQLKATISFASAAANPMAECCWQSVKEGTLRAVSVGFNPKTVRAEKRDGREIYVLDDNELFEMSVTPIPANPECLGKMRARAIAAPTQPAVFERGGDSPQQKQVSNMELAEKTALEKTIADREADVRSVEKRALDAETQVKALDAQNKHLVTERDAAVSRACAAEAVIVEKDVDALVGKKITPAERESFVELAKSNRPLFDKMVGQRSDLKLLGAPVVGAEPDASKIKGVTLTAGDELLAAIEA